MNPTRSFDGDGNMTELEIRAFHDSYERCMKDQRFFDLFYEDFLNTSPEVREKFQDTNFSHQKRALRMSLLLIMESAVRKTKDFTVLENTAQRHSRTGSDIQPHLYSLWLDSLVRTVRVCDEDFTSEIGILWRKAFQPAVDFLVSRY